MLQANLHYDIQPEIRVEMRDYYSKLHDIKPVWGRFT